MVLEKKLKTLLAIIVATAERPLICVSKFSPCARSPAANHLYSIGKTQNWNQAAYQVAPASEMPAGAMMFYGNMSPLPYLTVFVMDAAGDYTGNFEGCCISRSTTYQCRKWKEEH